MIANKRDTYSSLLEKLSSRVPRLLEKAQASLAETTFQNRVKGISQPDNDVVTIVLPEGEPKLEIALGFPFPLTRLTKDLSADKGSILICFRGGELREVQREFIITALDAESKNCNLHEFRKIVTSLASGRSKCVYINPYTYLGDSYIGLYFMYRIMSKFDIQDRIIFSPTFMHQQILGQVYSPNDMEAKALISEDDLIIMPDLIDSHLDATLDWLECFKKRNNPVLLLGRGILFDGKNKKTTCLLEENPLLRNSNIQEYMDDCLLQFIDLQETDTPKKTSPAFITFAKTSKSSVFINPFASLKIRDLTVKEIADIIEAVEYSGYAHVYISHGVQCDKDNILIAELQDMLTRRHFNIPVTIKTFEDLSHLGSWIKDSGVGLSFSPDTSVPHLLNEINHVNITVYKEEYWDERSLQSLSGDSPLGFCRYQLSQIPVVIGKNHKIDAGIWIRFLKFLVSDYSGEIKLQYKNEINALLKNLPESRNELFSLYHELVQKFSAEIVNDVYDIGYFEKIVGIHNPEYTADFYKSMICISPLYKWLCQTC